MPMGRSPGKSIKWPKVYEALKKQGMSKSQAAAISNAMWNKRHKETPEKYSHIDFTPPQGAREAAKRALEVRSNKPSSQRGMTAVGIARARDLINAKMLSPETIRRMNNYFTRHEVDKQGSTWSEQGKGWQAWMGWGGDAGKSWAAKVVRQMNAADGKMTTKEAANTGVMIALFLKPDDAKRLALTDRQAPNSELLPAQDLHITLAYLGDTTEMDGEAKMRAVVALLKLATHCRVLQGKVSGIGRFTTIEDGSTNAVYASIDSPALPSFRQMVVDTLEELGVPMASNHGFTPHATLAYIPSNADTPNVTLPALDLVFDKVTLAWADERISFNLRPLIQPVVETDIITDGVSGVEAVSTKHMPGKHNQADHAHGRRGGGGGKGASGAGGTSGGSDDNKPADKPTPATERKPAAKPSQSKPEKSEKPRATPAPKSTPSGSAPALGALLAAGGMLGAVALAAAFGGNKDTADEKTQELVKSGLIEETRDDKGNKAYRLTEAGKRRADLVGKFKAYTTKAEAGDNDKPAKASGGRGYGARAGEVIRGNLARGNDGQFTSANNASAASASKPPAKRESFQQRLARVQEQQKLAKKKPAKGGKGGKSQAQRDADKKKAEAEKLAKQQAREAEAEKKRTEREAKRAEDKAKRDVEREAERQKRDAERAARVAAKPAKPAKAEKPDKSGGGKGEADKKKPAKAASDKKSANRRKTQDDLEKSGIERDVLDAVLDASDGGDVTPERWQDLANKGLAIRFPGGYRLSGVGRAMARAADRGDTARAAAAYRATQKKSHKSIALKHLPGGHNQRSHGRSTGRRAAYRASYSEMRSLGYSPAESREIAKSDSKQYAEEHGKEGKQPRNYYAEGKLDEGDAAFRKTGDKWVAGLTDAEKQSLGFYQGDGFKEINRNLRGQVDYGESASKVLGGHTSNIDSAINKSRIPENTVAYRGFLAPEGGFKAGSVIDDKGYMSTSLSQDIAQGFADNYGSRGAIARINLNKGDKGAYLSSLDNTLRESEVLLPRGTKYKITKVSTETIDGVPRTVIDVSIDKSGRVRTSRKKEYTQDGKLMSDDKFGSGDADYTYIPPKPNKVPQTKKKESSGEDLTPSVTISSIIATLKQAAPWLTACRHAYRSAYLAARINGFSAEEARRIGKLASGKMRADTELRRRYRKYGYR